MTGVIIPSKFESEALTVPHHLSGMGKIRATMAVHHLASKGCNKILLSGFCGGVANCKIGESYSPMSIVEMDFNVGELEKPHIMDIDSRLQFNIANFICQDSFMTNSVTTESKVPLVIDMESYAVAYACQELLIPFYCVKVVSDIVGNNSTVDFLDSCKTLSSKLNKTIISALNFIDK